MYAGLKAAAEGAPDFIVAIDGDGQADVAEIPRFMQPLLDGEADFVLGSRFLTPGLVKYHYRLINRVGTIILSWMLRKMTGLPLTDSHGGLRAMRCDVARELDMLGTHTYVQETIIDAAEKGFRIKEISSVWKQREVGKSRVVSSIPKYVFYTLPTLLLRDGQHIRTLYSCGIALVMFALAYFLTILVQANFDVKATASRVPAFIWITLLLSVGVQMFFFGFVLQLLKQMKYRLDRTEYDGLSRLAVLSSRVELEGQTPPSLPKRIQERLEPVGRHED
jgi:hypothetical protein